MGNFSEIFIQVLLNSLGAVSFVLTVFLIMAAAPFAAFLWYKMMDKVVESYERRNWDARTWHIVLLRIAVWAVTLLVFFFALTLEVLIVPLSFWEDGPTPWAWGGGV